ncbi:MAG: amylo-alpha-1,6-glucosidase [Acidobacteriota bacterium]
MDSPGMSAAVSPELEPRPTVSAVASRCRDLEQSSQLEWLETNGTGAFAMGTVAGINTRRYHGLLVASLKPPVERFVLLSRVEEEAICSAGTVTLSACQYPGTVAGLGFDHLEEFRPDPCATWRFAFAGLTLEKQVYLVPGRQAVVIRYRPSVPITLRVRPFLAYRDYHSLTHSNASLNPAADVSPGIVRMKPYAGLPALELHNQGSFTADPHWYHDIEYLAELDRGLDFREDLFTPGVLTLELRSDTWTSIVAAAEPLQDGDEIDSPPCKLDPFVVRRADGRPTIIAGYPWFTDWGRDTMISLPGLLITPGRLEEAREIIEGFLEHRDKGIIPNRFPDAGETPEYNTADATLWMFQAVRQWLAAGGNRSFLRDVFYPAAKEILDWHMRGTWYGIGADPADGLLNAGTPGTQLTWMDAKVGEWVVTPRHGKPVEINALWHGALVSMASWAIELGDAAAAEQYATAAKRARDSFREKFWNPTRECLHDVLPPQGSAEKFRPNQIFAVSLPYDLLDLAQRRAVVKAVAVKLLTPVGLRTLDPADPEYRGRYEGSPHDRDGAYHQGTVWPWLMGPFIDAYLNAFGQTPDTLRDCRNMLHSLDQESASHGCLGSLAEIYDGDKPRHPRGCPAQAWSVAEIARVRSQYNL